MDKVTLKLNKYEMEIMGDFCLAMVDQFTLDLKKSESYPNAKRQWSTRLVIASLVKLNSKLASKLALYKKESKVSFSIFDFGGFMAGLTYFKWDEPNPYAMMFIERLKQEIEPKF